MFKFLHSQKYQNNFGMTLIEILIVVSIMSMVSVAIYASLSNGLKVWKRHHELVVEEDIVIFFEKLTQDLRNAFEFSQFEIEGQEQKFSFPTIVQIQMDDEMIQQIGKVEYYFDLLDRSMYRREAQYGQALQEQYGMPVKLIANIQQFMIRFYYITEDGESVFSSPEQGLPAGIEIEFKFISKGKERSMRRYIDIPQGR